MTIFLLLLIISVQILVITIGVVVIALAAMKTMWIAEDVRTRLGELESRLPADYP